MYRPGAARPVAHLDPLTVLISGQLRVPAWRLPVSVPFANFSSQDRHKTQGTPAAVHPNPVLSMSLSNTRGDDRPRSGFGFGSSTQETLTHGAEEPAALAVVLLKHMWFFFFLQESCKMRVLCSENRLFGSRYDCTCYTRGNPLFNTAVKAF